MCTPTGEPPAGLDPEWDAAPCALLRLDASGRVVAANAHFLAQTGHLPHDVHGRLLWSDLLSPGSRVIYQTQLAPVLELDGQLREVLIELRTSGGERLPVLLNATSVRDSDGKVACTNVALMSIPDRRAYENELRQARDEAERARAADLHARHRLELLTQASTALASSTDVNIALARLATVLASGFADWSIVYAPAAEDTDAVSWSAAHIDSRQQLQVERLAALLPGHARTVSALRRALDHGEPTLIADVSEQHLLASTGSPEVLASYAALGVGSAVVVPIMARGLDVAAIIAVRSPARVRFDSDDLADLQDLASRAGIVIDNLRRQAREHSNSVALQQALLTTAPEAPGLQIATRYLPATNGNEVGGDWYDTFLQLDGAPVFVIGDVVGHDIHAAAGMGQLRGVLRTVGYLESGTPAQILTRADAAARGLSVAVLATALVARIETGPDGTATLCWSNAGHPPPVLITQHGARLLDAAPDRPLGLMRSLDRPRHDHRVAIAPGDTLLLYTDGLVERTDEELDAGLARLIDRLAGATDADLDEFCELVLKEHSPALGIRDDVALLAVRVDAR
jgi:PAS domain S-box-containing protein